MSNEKHPALEDVEEEFQRGLAHHRQGNLDQALRIYRNVISRVPRHFNALHLSGLIAAQSKDFAEAAALIQRAVDEKPESADARYNLGVVHEGLRRIPAAIACYDKAIALRPNFREALTNRGNALRHVGDFAGALQSYDAAIGLHPNFAEAHINRALALAEMKRFDVAVEKLNEPTVPHRQHPLLAATRLTAKLRICDWNEIDGDILAAVENVERGVLAAQPFTALALVDSARVHGAAARTWIAQKHPGNSLLGPIPRREPRGRIKLGYFSRDFREHAVARLIAELIEIHDRGRFEVIAFSFGPQTPDIMRHRLEQAFDSFMDIGGHSDTEVAVLAREMCLDIAVDLAGHTHDARPDIFALRAAPIQVNFLGYPGTLGADYIDYIVADASVVPEAARIHYSEKVAYLPHSYQANDSRRQVSDRPFNRAQLGLPTEGFVFCCFNNSFKILPDVFNAWVAILNAVDNSVMWLLEDNPYATANLRKEAARRGVDPHRLVFAPRMPPAEHLARHRAADLFLDTLPYNAHTTASDALWMGLPVLTREGEGFAGRVGASLLRAVGLPELVTTTVDDYIATAIRLANDKHYLRAIAHKLNANRQTAPLFDTPSFARHLEDAYQQMHARWVAGLPPAHITITPRRG